METDEKRYRLVQSRVVVTSFVLLVLAFGVIMGFFNGWILLVGAHVVRAGMLSGSLLLVSLVLWVFWNVRRGRGKGPTTADGRWVWVGPLSYFLLLAVVGAGTAMVALFDWGTKGIVLDAQGRMAVELLYGRQHSSVAPAVRRTPSGFSALAAQPANGLPMTFTGRSKREATH